MNRPAGLAPAVGLSLTLGIALGSPPVEGQSAAPPAAPAGSTQTPWNSSTVPQPPRPPSADGTLSLRIYSDTNDRSLAPDRPGASRRDDPGYAVDVSAVMTRCADGNLLITALVIGGQLTPLDNRCPAEPAGTPTAPACDANRWNCSTSGPQPAK